jgi:hypothetical protein
MNYKFTLLLLSFTLVVNSGHAEERSKLDQLYDAAAKAAGIIKDRGKPRQVDKTKTPQFIIKGSEIRYNGIALRLGDTIDSWQRALGSPSRNDDYNYTWDDLGVQLVLRRKRSPEGWSRPTNKIAQVELFFNFRKKESWEESSDARPQLRPDGSVVPQRPDSRPKSPFEGYLEIDGAGVDRNTMVWEINDIRKGYPDMWGSTTFRKSYSPVEFMAITPPPESYHMYINTDGKGREGMIYSIGINEGYRGE